MEKKDLREFTTLMGKASLAFLSDQIAEETLMVYWEYLCDRSIYQIRHGINDIIKQDNKFPTVSRIREVSGAYREMKTTEIISPERQVEEFTSNTYPKTKEEQEIWFNKILEEAGI